jgi:hypothetical protein
VVRASCLRFGYLSGEDFGLLVSGRLNDRLVRLLGGLKTLEDGGFFELE